MEFLPFGESLKNIRKRAGLSQKELASGICAQAQISKIEKNDEIPSALVLKEISKKLGVDMNYFFDIQESHKTEYITKIKSEIRNFKKQKNYTELYKLISKVKNNPLFQEGENLKFLSWHEALCVHYVESEPLKAITLLKEALQINPFEKGHFFKELDIEIVNSIAILEKEVGMFEEAEMYFMKALDLLKQIPKLTDPTIELRTFFGLAQLYTDTNRFEESLELSQKGIKLCNKLETLYLLGQFQYQAGENHAKMGEKTEAKKAFDRATLIFQLQDNYSYVKLIKQLEEELFQTMDR